MEQQVAELDHAIKMKINKEDRAEAANWTWKEGTQPLESQGAASQAKEKQSNLQIQSVVNTDAVSRVQGSKLDTLLRTALEEEELTNQPPITSAIYNNQSQPETERHEDSNLHNSSKP